MRKAMNHKFTLAVLASTVFGMSTAFANTLINTPVVVPQQTNGANQNTIEITPTGSIILGKVPDAVSINSVANPGVTNGGNLIIDAGNKFSFAINLNNGESATQFYASPVLPGGTMDLGLNSSIRSTQEIIFVDNTETKINIRGFVVGGANLGDGIQISANGTATTVNVLEGGSIFPSNSFPQGGITTAIKSDAGAPSASLYLSNSGTILAHGNQNAIRLLSPFSAIENLPGGLIVHDPLPGLDFPGAVILIKGTDNGPITNHLGGRIQNLFGGDGIQAQGRIGHVINDGLIEAQQGIALNIQTSTPGMINTGVIQNLNSKSAVVFLNAGVVLPDGFVNTGIIYNNDPDGTAIDFTAVAFGIITQNEGIIRGTVVTAEPFNADPVFVMNGGALSGDLFSYINDGSSYQINGGTISRGIDLNNNNTLVNTLELNGGMVAGLIETNDSDQIIFNGSKINQMSGDNTSQLTLMSGSFNKIQYSQNSGFTDVIGHFVSKGILLVPGLDINPGNTLEAYNLIDDLVEMEIEQGGTYIPHNLTRARVTGPLTRIANEGLMWIQDKAVYDLIGDPLVPSNRFYFAGAGGTLRIDPGAKFTIQANFDPTLPVVNFGDPGNPNDKAYFNPRFNGQFLGPVLHGFLEVTSYEDTPGFIDVDFNPGSIINPEFVGFIPDNQTAEIVHLYTAFGSIIDDDSVLQNPNSQTVYFTKELVATTSGADTAIVLTSHRRSYLSVAPAQITLGVTNTLDNLALGSGPTNRGLFDLLAGLDQDSRAGIASTLESLIPPFNYGMIDGTHIGMKIAFDAVTDRVWDVEWNHKNHGRRHSEHPRRWGQTGVNQGDYLVNSTAGIWFRPLGAYLNQSQRNQIEGYRAKAAGGAIGYDWGINNCGTIGIAASYVNVNVDDKANAPKNEKIKSWQGTLYGSFDLVHGMFLDIMGAYSRNDYDLNRVIATNVFTTAAQASTKGNQWGLQGDLGMALTNYDAFLAPFIRLQYLNVDIDDYVENGAGSLNLAVANNEASNFMGGIGVKFASDFEYNGFIWVPELTALLGYDFSNDGQQTVANFAGGGLAFATYGVTPSPTLLDLGLAVNAMCPQQHIVYTLKYNVELRDKYVGNSAYAQMFYTWG